MAPMEDVKEELVQATVEAPAVVGAVTLSAPIRQMVEREISETYRSADLRGAYRAGMSSAATICDDKMRIIAESNAVRGGRVSRVGAVMMEIAHSCGDDIMAYRDLIRVENSSLTADPGPGTAGGSLEPNLPSLLNQVSVLKEALERIGSAELKWKPGEHALTQALAFIDMLQITAREAQGLLSPSIEKEDR